MTWGKFPCRAVTSLSYVGVASKQSDSTFLVKSIYPYVTLAPPDFVVAAGMDDPADGYAQGATPVTVIAGAPPPLTSVDTPTI